MKKFLVVLLMVMMLVPTIGVRAEEYNTAPIDQITEKNPSATPEPTVKPEVNDPSLDYVDGTIINPDITMDEATSHVMKKLNEVVDFLKKIAEPISYIMFIVGAIMMVFGAVGKRDGVKQGLVVCVIAIIMFAICRYSEPIIHAFTNWFAS